MYIYLKLIFSSNDKGSSNNEGRSRIYKELNVAQANDMHSMSILHLEFVEVRADGLITQTFDLTGTNTGRTYPKNTGCNIQQSILYLFLKDYLSYFFQDGYV